MRASLFITALLHKHLAFLKFGSTRLEADQPLSFVFGGWTWAQAYLDVVDHEPMISFLSRPASFGPHITEEPGLPGYLIPFSALTTTCPANASASLPLPFEPPLGDDELPENFACPPICTDPAVRRPTSTENWIALIQRGQCPFAEKVRSAQVLGAKAVIIGGWRTPDGERDDLLNMFSPEDASDIVIPSTYVTFRSYSHLMALIAASNTTTSGTNTISVILRAEESWGWFSPILTFLMLLLLPSFLTFLTLLIHRLREARRERLDRAPEDVVSHLPTRIWSGNGWEKEGDWLKKLRRRALETQAEGLSTGPAVDKSSETLPFDLEGQQGVPSLHRNMDTDYASDHDSTTKPGEGDQMAQPIDGTSDAAGVSSGIAEDEIPGRNLPWFDGQLECAICLCSFDPGDKVRILPCGHLFHVEEVDSWLVQRKKLCPICKLDVTLPGGSASSPPNPQSPPPNTILPTALPRQSLRATRVRDWLSRSLPMQVPFRSRPRNEQDSAGSAANATTLPSSGPTERSPLLPRDT